MTAPEGAAGCVVSLWRGQLRQRVRLMGSSATIAADLGAVVAVDCVAPISATLGAGATLQARLSNVTNFSVTPAETTPGC